MIISEQVKIPVISDLTSEYVEEFLGEGVVRWAITSVGNDFYIVDCAIEK